MWTATGKGGQEDWEHREWSSAELKTLKCPLVKEEQEKEGGGVDTNVEGLGLSVHCNANVVLLHCRKE